MQSRHKRSIAPQHPVRAAVSPVLAEARWPAHQMGGELEAVAALGNKRKQLTPDEGLILQRLKDT